MCTGISYVWPKFQRIITTGILSGLQSFGSESTIQIKCCTVVITSYHQYSRCPALLFLITTLCDYVHIPYSNMEPASMIQLPESTILSVSCKTPFLCTEQLYRKTQICGVFGQRKTQILFWFGLTLLVMLLLRPAGKIRLRTVSMQSFSSILTRFHWDFTAPDAGK